ncbi:MAG: acylneuraminate cytidylyltransferase family protein [Roseburia sp. 1XD42-69]|jgi:CMP-N-acetylneuraminic acid synthetase
MKILFTMCGRAGSKGIKNKNIRSFAGKPLPYYSISAIDLFLKTTELKIDYDIVVNTDSMELIDLMKENPFRKVQVIERKPELCNDVIGKIEVIRDCYFQMTDHMGKSYDMVVDLDLTSPLRTVTDMENLIKKQRETNADVTTSVTDARRNPYFNQLKRTEHGFKKVIESDFTARQQAPEVFDMNASLYAYNPEYLLTGKGVLDGYCECIEMKDTGILDLDHENDFALMEVIAEYLFETDDGYGEVKKNILE